jgi:hypothetical protein
MRTPKLGDEILMSEPLKTYLDIAKELMPVPREQKDVTPASSNSQSSSADAMAVSVCTVINVVAWTKVRELCLF